MSDQPKKAFAISETQVDQTGELVGFVFAYDDGSKAGVQCDAVRLTDMVNTLIGLGATASQMRANFRGTGGPIHIMPREVIAVNATRGFGGDVVVLGANTAEGPPIHLKLTLDQARAAITALEAACSEPAPSAAKVMN